MQRLAVAFLLLTAMPAAAQHAGHDMSMGAAGAAAAQESASTRELREANAQMHRAMDMPFTGDADRDFAAAMIPHHEGAIAMARIELRHGTDPAMRRMAEAIIAAQEREIAELRAFLARPR
ncbi:MAG TPA: DUF305 domain-containing protein [Roseomonas sp.]|jgi:uncharacterized protein (DUF305 family)